MKKLPKIYHKDSINFKNNNKDYCIFKNTSEISNQELIKEKINNIFKGLEASYNIPVIIKTKNNIYDTYLISRTRDNIITKENEIIPIKEIIILKEKN